MGGGALEVLYDKRGLDPFVLRRKEGRAPREGGEGRVGCLGAFACGCKFWCRYHVCIYVCMIEAGIVTFILSFFLALRRKEGRAAAGRGLGRRKEEPENSGVCRVWTLLSACSACIEKEGRASSAGVGRKVCSMHVSMYVCM